MSARLRPPRSLLAIALALPALLTGCDLLGIESPGAVAARREAEGKAIGAGCRHSGRSIEQCYALNKRADKASMFAGWKEMNDYMRENKIETAPPPVEPSTVAEEGTAEPAAKPAAKGTTKAAEAKH